MTKCINVKQVFNTALRQRGRYRVNQHRPRIDTNLLYQLLNQLSQIHFKVQVDTSEYHQSKSFLYRL